MKIAEEESIYSEALKIHDFRTRSEFLSRLTNDPVIHQRIESRVAQQLKQASWQEMEATTVCKGQGPHADNKPNSNDGFRPLIHENEEAEFQQTEAPDLSGVSGTPQIGSRIGKYKLLQLIGHGGMGLVYMAEQSEPVRRKVAIKVIKVGMDTERVVARFESERQALALMDHPCITKVLDAGATDQGRPFFVMELVRGQTVTEYCDEQRLSVRDRLKIFAQVCNAVEHAHQKGIIHRDVKPSNIMVTSHDGVPVPKIIDFGIAKAIHDRLTDKTLFTNYGEMIGTPLYMSPEQAEMNDLDADTRSDIYSLGVVLYELLTGTTPYRKKKDSSLADIRDAIRSQPLQLASTRVNDLGVTIKEVTSNRSTDLKSLERFIRGELDWILLKCLARDREERYQSAGELSREIQRYLNGENVEAAAPTLRYRAAKMIIRHKTAAAVALLVATLLFAATSFSTWMAIKANRAEQLANQRLNEVTQERDRAILAEKQLADLERKQRNRVAIHRAASKHNAEMVRQFLVQYDSPKGEGMLKLPTDVQIRTVTTQCESGQPDECTKSGTATAKFSDDHEFSVSWRIPSTIEDEVELVVIPNVGDGELSFLRSMLKNQKEEFGEADVVVANTLNRLGERTLAVERWDESEDYFRQAADIFARNSINDKKIATQLGMVKKLKNKWFGDRAKPNSTMIPKLNRPLIGGENVDQ